MEIQITQEQIDAMLYRVIEDKLDAATYDGGIDVVQRAKEVIERTVRKKALNELDGRVDAIVEGIVDEFLQEPVTTDDGWGHRETFDTHTDMFAHYVHDRLCKSYEMERKIHKLIEEKVKEIWNKVSKNATEIIVAEMAKEVNDL